MLAIVAELVGCFCFVLFLMFWLSYLTHLKYNVYICVKAIDMKPSLFHLYFVLLSVALIVFYKRFKSFRKFWHNFGTWYNLVK